MEGDRRDSSETTTQSLFMFIRPSTTETGRVIQEGIMDWGNLQLFIDI